ncbi:hypothetical protein [Tsuneonella amylolytica]|uniref:hypothetical protein n=1 Tax=Tsuneonella amylolytica TaxID=2338327 RepID=UPI000EAA56E1|nr:hypothetical protein [Tsuneonella amylolytica]
MINAKPTIFLLDPAHQLGHRRLGKTITANPSMELVLKLAQLFRVRVADLVGENPDAEDQPAETVAVFRDLKNMDTRDRETIQMMMEILKERRELRD